MDIEWIKNKLRVGRGRTCVVDISLSQEFPGYVRTVRINPDSRVSIEFEQYGYDEGGVYFRSDYPSLEEALRAVESYLNRPLSTWPRVAGYPSASGAEDSSEGHVRLQRAIATRQVPLPQGGHWTMHGDWWQRFLEEK